MQGWVWFQTQWKISGTWRQGTQLLGGAGCLPLLLGRHWAVVLLCRTEAQMREKQVLPWGGQAGAANLRKNNHDSQALYGWAPSERTELLAKAELVFFFPLLCKMFPTKIRFVFKCFQELIEDSKIFHSLTRTGAPFLPQEILF